MPDSESIAIAVAPGVRRCFRAGVSRVSCTPQAEERPVMKVGLFMNTQFPEGFNLAECVPGDSRTGARGA
jgi:hypothetical protein